MPEGTQIRRLVLMFDGTWNEKSDWTNVARMSEAIDIIQDHETENVQSSEPEPVQLVKYLAGVKKLKAFTVNNTRPIQVKMLGVWDTVGDLGIPDSAFMSKIPVLKLGLNFLCDYGPWLRKH